MSTISNCKLYLRQGISNQNVKLSNQKVPIEYGPRAGAANDPADGGPTEAGSSTAG